MAEYVATGTQFIDSDDSSLHSFAADVHRGLTARTKHLHCVYFYDDRGSQLFEEICQQPEYYPARAEAEILQAHAAELATLLTEDTALIELGSGSSIKTRYLIEAFMERHDSVHYIPIDVSETMLVETTAELRSYYSNLTVEPVVARYEEGLAQIEETHQEPKLVLWLGGSIGNLGKKEAAAFLKNIVHGLTRHDHLMVGIDLFKDKSFLESAYNDSAGLTAEFNLNILNRINNELGGNFNLGNFSHLAVFNEYAGRIEMYLRSNLAQTIRIDDLDLEIKLADGELIHTENSHKYKFEEIETLGLRIGRRLKKQWLDSKRRFSLNLFTAISS
ncbi:L-histidine N(alpha)-methyltransferase [Candidatus Neomarinimicrobiota bacterium]